MSWSAPNYRLADAYINNTIDERDTRRTVNPFQQAFMFNNNGIQGSDNAFKRKIQEILAQPDYNQPKEAPPVETLTDKIDIKDEYLQDQFDDKKREILTKQNDSLSDKHRDDDHKKQPVSPCIHALPVVQPYIIKHASSPLDSILTTAVLVIVGVLLCFLVIRALFPIEAPEPRQIVGNMNIDAPVNETEQNDAEN